MAPVIIATDKTQLTQFSGNKSAYPVYLTLGNIPRSIRRKPSQHACILIGYLPVDKIDADGLTQTEKKARGQRLFHEAMRHILEPLIDAGNNGVEITCADGWVRRIYPLLAAYVADYPEQCLVTCAKPGTCPKCRCPSKDLQNPAPYDSRTPTWTIDVMESARQGAKNRAQFWQKTHAVDLSGGVYDPFWKDFPYCDIHQAITPDVLHQLYQGVFAHLLEWATLILGAEELDRRIRCVPGYSGIRQFKKGISKLSQISGSERKDMAKILLACLIGRVSKATILAFRSILDFIYLAQYPTHNDDTLQYMKDALATFQKHKHVFIDLKIRDHLNIPKFHSLLHYITSIRLYGTTDNYNTEMFERLHIDYAKEAWRSTNHRNELPQMMRWLERREKMTYFERYITHHMTHHIPSTAFPISPKSPCNDRTGTGQITIRAKPDVAIASIVSIEKGHNAPGFSRAIREFLSARSSVRISRTDIAQGQLPFDEVSLYYSFTMSRVELGHTEVLSSYTDTEVVKARPKTSRQPGNFDSVIVLDTPDAEATGVEGEHTDFHKLFFFFLIVSSCHRNSCRSIEGYIPFTFYGAW